MKITLFLMTQKGFEVLNALLKGKFQQLISEVIVGRDKNIENDYANEIILLCKKNQINFFERNRDFKIVSNYSIAISWRWIIPESESRLIVLHDSLLPKYRGFAPLVNMLINREDEIGVSAIFASDEYDKGDIIAQSSTKIKYPITILQAINLISQNYIKIVLEIFNRFQKGSELTAVKQSENLATYSLWREEDDYMIDWQKEASEILNFINAVSYPYKGATTYIDGFQKVRVFEAELECDVKIENRDVGKVIFVKHKLPVIVCGTGLLKLMKVIDDKTSEDLLPFKNFRIRLISNPKLQLN